MAVCLQVLPGMEFDVKVTLRYGACLLVLWPDAAGLMDSKKTLEVCSPHIRCQLYYEQPIRQLAFIALEAKKLSKHAFSSDCTKFIWII